MIKIIDVIEKVKHNTSTSIENIQKAKIPSVYKLILERRYSFKTHGFYHSAYKETSLLYLCHNLPYTIDHSRHVFSLNLKDLVEKGWIQPFLLFVDNKFIKWSDITIINDCNYAYILIDNNSNLYTPECECIVLHFNINYNEKLTRIPNNSLFSFNDIGLHCIQTREDELYTCITPNEYGLSVYHEDILLNEGVKQQSLLNGDYKLFASNYIAFRNGYLDTDASIVQHGLNLFSVNDNKFKGNDYLCKLFYYTNTNSSLDNINVPPNRSHIFNRLNVDNTYDYMKTLSIPFDFKFDRNLEYDQNIRKALDYIMEYNGNIMQDIYKEVSNIKSLRYTGKQIKVLQDDKGYVKMSRKYNDSLNSGIMIFVNGLLYNSYNELKFDTKDFTFPVVDIKDNDVIEILYFKNIDNRITPMYFSSEASDEYQIDTSIDLENCSLYTTNPEKMSFNIDRIDTAQYEVPFQYKRLNGNNCEVKLLDSFYYDKSLNLTSRRQFRYMCQIMKADSRSLVLSKDFNFCTDESRYMVFINGRKIDKVDYILTMIRPSRPFYEISAYIRLKLKAGDKLEVFYVPEVLHEIVTTPELYYNGKVVINRDTISYDLNKDLYMIFVNGRKLTPDELVDIGSNRIKISGNLKSLKNLTIIKHVEDNIVLSTIFGSTNSLMDKVCEETFEIPGEFDKMIDTNIKASDNEVNIKQGSTSTKSLVYEVIRDYYLRPYINTGEEFDYDFYPEFTDKDDDGNILIDYLDANKEDKLK